MRHKPRREMLPRYYRHHYPPRVEEDPKGLKRAPAWSDALHQAKRTRTHNTTTSTTTTVNDTTFGYHHHPSHYYYHHPQQPPQQQTTTTTTGSKKKRSSKHSSSLFLLEDEEEEGVVGYNNDAPARASSIRCASLLLL